MQKHVPFFMLLFVLSFAAHAQNIPKTWEEVRKPLGCPTDFSTLDAPTKIRCERAKQAFCGSDSGCKIREAAPRGLSRQAFQDLARKAAERCQKDEADANSTCKTERGSPYAQQIKTEGMESLCKQMNNATEAAAKFNSQVGGLCQGLKARCESSCQAMQKVLEDAANGCSDREGCNTDLASAKSALNQHVASCNGVDAGKYLDQSRATTNAANIAENCKDLVGQPGDQSGGKTNKKNETAGSGMNPAMLMGLAQMAMSALGQQNQQQQQPQSATNPALDAVDCGVNPNLAGCPSAATTASDSWNSKEGTAGAVSSDPAGGGFNVADDSQMMPASAEGGDPRQASAPPTVGGVPNGGGQMPGGGGGAPASLGGGGGGGGAGGGSKTDVLHGMSSGGGGMGAMNASMNMKNGESGGGYNYGQGAYRDEGLDLSQFLPGGKQDPTRKIAGIASGGPGNFQIQSKDVNIWARISERIKARCSQGLLRDCIP